MVEKKLSLTRLPGSPLNFLDSLRRSFLWINENETTKKLVTIVTLSQWIRGNLGWEKSSVQAARFIYSTFMTMDSGGYLHLTDWVKEWLLIEDNTIRSELLFDYLSDRIFFFGEILDLLNTPKNADDLLDAVVLLHPAIRWHNSGLLNTRLDWLMACDKVKKRGTLYCLSPIIQDDKETMVGHYRQNLNIGEIGEQYVLADEKDSLRDCPHLAKKVRRVSLYAPRAGYDILSYFPDGRLKFIEVKATPGEDTNFEMTHNEWLTARRFGDSYFVYRVTNINNMPNIAKIQNPAVNLSRRPLVWKMNYAIEGNSESVESSTVLEKDLQRRLQLETILQELPREDTIFVSRRGTWPQKFFIKWEEDLARTDSCLVCLGEEKEMIRVGYAVKQSLRGWTTHIDLTLCVDCFLRFRELFL